MREHLDLRNLPSSHYRSTGEVKAQFSDTRDAPRFAGTNQEACWSDVARRASSWSYWTAQRAS